MKRKLILSLVLAAATMSVQGQNGVEIRLNQVGYAPQQEKVIVVEGVNPAGKVRIATPDGRKLKAKSVRKATSPWSGKVRYVVDLGQLS